MGEDLSRMDARLVNISKSWMHMKFSFAHFTEDLSDLDHLDKEGSFYTDDDIMDWVRANAEEAANNFNAGAAVRRGLRLFEPVKSLADTSARSW